jgi:5-methylcytosine-specific restriction protein A
MIVSIEKLERLFDDFVDFVTKADQKKFTSFSTSAFIETKENYKYSVYNKAREKLGQKLWKPMDIGTGKIQNYINEAIQPKVDHGNQTVDNNLVDWRKKDAFSKFGKSQKLEEIFFNFYKSKISDQQAFESLIEEKLSYQFIAYLFFIKDRNRFLPISQKKFDEIFELLGIEGFKTSHNLSWDNYINFLDLIKQVHVFLKGKDNGATLLDAHSFLWVLGNQMKSTDYSQSSHSHEANESLVVELGTLSQEPTSPIQNAYLFVWNPSKWDWVGLEQNIEEIQNRGATTLRWSCRSHKSIKVGDRAFLVRLGDEPRGIMASGYVVSEPFLSPHWSGEDRDVPRVLIEFDVIINPKRGAILSLDLLKTSHLAQQHWTPQTSGISIRSDLVAELEAIWFDFLSSQDVRVNPFVSFADFSQIFIEGAATQVAQIRYERNPYARRVCIAYYGYSCSVCDFNFVDKYGNLGIDFIHVHHLTPVATIGQTYTVDPISDLRPVCPNCHAMLHKRNPPFTINELKMIVDKDNKST